MAGQAEKENYEGERGKEREEEERNAAIDVLQDIYARLGWVRDVNAAEKLRKNNVDVKHIRTMISAMKKILKQEK